MNLSQNVDCLAVEQKKVFNGGLKGKKHDQGQVLLDVVFKHLDLTERDYFGLQLADESTDNPRCLSAKHVKHILLIYKFNFSFIAFFNRYQYFLQIKQDILTGRLPCPYNTAALLASYAVQSELGDYNHSETLPGYLSDYSFIPSQPQDFEKEIAKLHQQHIGLSPAEAEFNYLNTARTLELYGVELHYARDQSNNEIMIGVMSGGILIFKNRVRINTFQWLKIVKISFKCKQFFIQLRKELHESRETLLGFNMVNYRACKNLWKACVEHHTFFRLDRPLPPQKNFFAHYFTLGSKFRYCGRTEVQSVQYGKERANKDRVFARIFTTQDRPIRIPRSIIKVKVDNKSEKSLIKSSVERFLKEHRCLLRVLANSLIQSSSDGVYWNQDKPNGGVPHDNLVMIRMKPDENGRFGFNVKGGYDQKMPVIVSRVAPGTPIVEDAYFQFIYWVFIPLFVIAVYDVVEEKLESEPDFQYIPEKSPLDGVHQDDNALRESMIQLAEGLITGTVLAQFDVKCHQYWPEPSGSSSYGNFQITCHSEEGNPAYVFREMTLTNLEKEESRQLTQIQYIAWPDHGVPDDSSDFLDFVCLVRKKRAGREEPVVVHCSAGIGRTGVLITMETAMCLIECNQPVYPLDIVRTMRDQRAMMIQTPSQYRFVCEAILKVYEEGFIKPLQPSLHK
ncbi:tyrosine-protein phosphatase non-receptor type 4 [Limosa lapponica baueri]|uniref:protein-tyrosine-phosphatase n=1 Tax=Limosa lapponica baueri TaxID=1758121 RepID=A0A2I0UIY7_LIMLA|nr:tyrosine-protein phosphatase non-receptor type 4 [Limosa lapponica baueri]